MIKIIVSYSVVSSSVSTSYNVEARRAELHRMIAAQNALCCVWVCFVVPWGEARRAELHHRMHSAVWGCIACTLSVVATEPLPPAASSRRAELRGIMDANCTHTHII